MSPEKGILTLIRAWKRLHTDWELILVGDGPLMSEIQSLKGENENIRLLGRLSSMEVNRILCEASISVLPSECYENFPISLLEAMANGLPVVGSRTGGIPEIIGSSGALFESGNEQDLAQSLDRLIKDADLRTNLRLLARERYLKHYSPEANGAQLEAIYSKAIHSHRSRRTASENSPTTF